MPYRLLGLLLLLPWLAACESGTKIESVEPSFGNISGNDDVVIHGHGFKPGMVVHFGENEVKSVIIDSPRRIRVKTPSGATGKVNVVIIDEDGKSYVLKNGFTYTSQGSGS